MSPLQARSVPGDSLLQGVQKNQGGYADCFTITVPVSTDLATFVCAFYTTWVFKLERVILKWLAGKPSTDAEARAIGDGSIHHYAAWREEGRRDNELLMGDFRGRTKSWFMVESEGAGSTRLYFGSSVLPKKRDSHGEEQLGFIVSLMMGFHKVYSRILLKSAARRLT